MDTKKAAYDAAKAKAQNNVDSQRQQIKEQNKGKGELGEVVKKAGTNLTYTPSGYGGGIYEH